jgi:hypothetical protein
LYQPAMQAGLKCDGCCQKPMRFPEVPNWGVAAVMDKRTAVGLCSSLNGTLGRVSEARLSTGNR